MWQIVCRRARSLVGANLRIQVRDLRFVEGLQHSIWNPASSFPCKSWRAGSAMLSLFGNLRRCREQAQMLVAWPTRAVPETQKFHVRYSDFSGPKIRMQGFQSADSGVMRMPLGSGPWSCGECDCKIWLAALDHPKPCFHMAALVYFQPFL